MTKSPVLPGFFLHKADLSLGVILGLVQHKAEDDGACDGQP